MKKKHYIHIFNLNINFINTVNFWIKCNWFLCNSQSNGGCLGNVCIWYNRIFRTKI